MTKILLFSTIVLAFGSLGIIKSQSYRQRVDELNNIRDMLQVLSTEINFRKDPLPLVFQRLSNQNNNIASQIMRRCHDLMKEKYELNICWQSAIDDVCAKSCLNTEDKAIIYDLGMQLGKSNIKGQTDLLQLTEEKIIQQINKATQERNSKGKMYGGLGFSTGLVIAVLLI